MKKQTLNKPTKETAGGIQPLDPREYPLARAQGSAGRDEVRAQAPRVPAPRQSKRPTPRSK